MGDVLSQVPVRFKLPLTFAFLCAVGFALGGYAVNKVARDALELQIGQRLADQTAHTHLIIDQALELLGRRVEDFASDGHVRIELDRLQAPENDLRLGSEEELVRHLRVNKLALAPELVDADLLDRAGEVLVRAYAEGAEPPTDFDRERLWYGPLRGPEPEYPYPTFVISTPVTAIAGGRRLGTLQIVVRADLWAEGLRQTLARAPLAGLRIGLRGLGGFRLPLVAGDAAGDAGGAIAGGEEAWEEISSAPLLPGWMLELAVDRRSLTLPVRKLVSTCVYMSIALAPLTLLLVLHARKFLLRPLQALGNAALRITAGEFSARVGYRSGDEVGHLAEAFDVMAGAVEERERSLVRTVDELRAQEAEIRREHDRLQAVIDSLEYGLFLLDRAGRVTLANAAARQLLQELDQGLLASQDCVWLDGGRHASAPRSCLECLIDHQRPPHSCVIAVAGRVYEIQVTSLGDRRGAESERVFVSRDVTEKRRQAALQAHQERLSVLGEVAAVIAHEMNNPLAAISMFSQMLLDGLDPSSPLHSHAQVVHRNTSSCKRTLRSLLDMAVTPSARPEDFDARDMVEDVVELLAPIAAQGQTVLRVDAVAEDGVLCGDELQLRQALVNLVMNAIQACGTAQGGEVSVGTFDRPGELVTRVSDAGPGVPPELRQRIFEPFFTTKPAGEGTGLGLPTTRRIVEAHGGHLVLDATSRVGATFELVLPRHPRSQPARRRPQRSEPGLGQVASGEVAS